MQGTTDIKNKKALTIICSSSIGLILLNIGFLISRYYKFDQYHWISRAWFLWMIPINLLMIFGIVLLYREQKAGLWIFFISCVLYFAVPSLAHKGDTVLGLMTPIYFIVYSTMFVQLGLQYKKMFFKP